MPLPPRDAVRINTFMYNEVLSSARNGSRVVHTIGIHFSKMLSGSLLPSSIHSHFNDLLIFYFPLCAKSRYAHEKALSFDTSLGLAY